MIEPKKGYFMNNNYTTINIRVSPRGSKNEITGWKDNILLIKTTSPPVDGAANESIIKLLSKHYRIRKSDIIIISGEKSRDKKIQFLCPVNISAKD